MNEQTIKAGLLNETHIGWEYYDGRGHKGAEVWVEIKRLAKDREYVFVNRTMRWDRIGLIRVREKRIAPLFENGDVIEEIIELWREGKMPIR